VFAFSNSTDVVLYVNGTLQGRIQKEDPVVVKNDADIITAKFYMSGDIVLKGSCFVSANCLYPGSGSIIFTDNLSNIVGYINSTGYMCLEESSCSDNDNNCNTPGDNSFIIKNSLNTIISYINSTGGLCMKGDLAQNENP
jgi:hypothetical protein